MKRARPKLAEPEAKSYFVSEKAGLKFAPTGCTILDCALGGGWAIGRIGNIVGDRSTAKTALATEAITNFLIQYPKGAAAYRDTEAAFDQSYAEAMGIPIQQIDFGTDEPLLTVEDFAKDFDKFLDARLKDETPGIYVLDSLDALSDDAEMEQEFGKATYGLAKAKMLSTFFRKTARKIEQSKVLLIIVSQVRDNIGVTFGAKYKRSGGKALDFYASQVIYLAHLKTLKRTSNKIERPIGVEIRAKVTKNKVGLPFREVDFTFVFGYGVDDAGASVAWLETTGHLDTIGLASSAEAKAFLKALEGAAQDDYVKECETVRTATKSVWASVEQTFIPIRKKYG